MRSSGGVVFSLAALLLIAAPFVAALAASGDLNPERSFIAQIGDDVGGARRTAAANKDIGDDVGGARVKDAVKESPDSASGRTMRLFGGNKDHVTAEASARIASPTPDSNGDGLVSEEEFIKYVDKFWSDVDKDGKGMTSSQYKAFLDGLLQHEQYSTFDRAPRF